MLLTKRFRSSTPLRSGLLIILTGACSKTADRDPPGADTASVTVSSIAPDTPTTRPDTTPAVDTQGAGVTQPKGPKPRIKPSIDPGRKATPTQPATAVVPPSAEPAAPAGSAEGVGQDKWIKYDAATNTVTFELIAGPFNFNGFTSGGATLVLPPKANVVMNFVNKDGTPHSAIIISGDGPIPNSATEPAIPRAYTNKVLEGLPQEAGDVMRFPVPESGTYRILCGVPGHGPAGMWIWMKVDPAAKAPSFGPTKA